MLWFNKAKKNSAKDTLGLTISDGQLAFCRLDTETSTLLAASVHDLAGATWERGLSDLVGAQGLKGLSCRLVLSNDDYKILPTEAPTVPEAEMDQALLWSLRDVLDAPPQEMVVQSFPFASGLNRPGRTMRHVVAARKNRIQALVKGVLDAGLMLTSIDIPELALRNIISLLPDNATGLGLVSQSSRHLAIKIYRSDELYVTRQLAGISDLHEASHPLTAPRLADQLGLDLLRTLDYYDSQLQQRPPAAIYLQPLPGDLSLLINALTETLRLPIRALRFEDVVTVEEDIPAETQASCLNALGGALRKEVS